MEEWEEWELELELADMAVKGLAALVTISLVVFGGIALALIFAGVIA
jgi:hypothetical protein